MSFEVIVPKNFKKNEISILSKNLFEPTDEIKFIRYDDNVVEVCFSYFKNNKNLKASLIKANNKEHILKLKSKTEKEHVVEALKSLLLYNVTGFFEFKPNYHSLQTILCCAFRLGMSDFFIELTENASKINKFLGNVDIIEFFIETTGCDPFSYETTVKATSNFIKTIIQQSGGMILFKEGRNKFNQSLVNIPISNLEEFIEICGKGLWDIEPRNEKSFVSLIYCLIYVIYSKNIDKQPPAVVDDREKINELFSKFIDNFEIGNFNKLDALGFILEHYNGKKQNNLLIDVKDKLRTLSRDLESKNEIDKKRTFLDQEIKEFEKRNERKLFIPEFEKRNERKLFIPEFEKKNERELFIPEPKLEEKDNGKTAAYSFQRERPKQIFPIKEEVKYNEEQEVKFPSSVQYPINHSFNKPIENKPVYDPTILTHHDDPNSRICELMGEVRKLTINKCNHRVCGFCQCQKMLLGTKIHTKEDINRYKFKCIFPGCNTQITSDAFNEADFETFKLVKDYI